MTACVPKKCARRLAGSCGSRPISADVRRNKICVSRIGVITDVDVEGEIAQLAQVICAAIRYLVGEPKVGGVCGIHGCRIAPAICCAELLAVGNRVFFILSMSCSLCATMRSAMRARARFSWIWQRISCLIKLLSVSPRIVSNAALLVITN